MSESDRLRREAYERWYGVQIIRAEEQGVTLEHHPEVVKVREAIFNAGWDAAMSWADAQADAQRLATERG